jgi:Xaa-Pro aminopeptidase
MLLTEPSSITPDDETVLKLGMVLTTEPGAARFGGVFLTEDVHVITEDESEHLTSESEKL